MFVIWKLLYSTVEVIVQPSPAYLEVIVCWNGAKGFLSDLKNRQHQRIKYRTMTQWLFQKIFILYALDLFCCYFIYI